MSAQPTSQNNLTFGGPFSPSLGKLRNELSRETAKCWLLVALTCIAIAPAFHLGLMMFALIASGTSAFGSNTLAQSGSPSSSFDTMFGVISMLSSLLGPLTAMILPIGLIIWAVMVNRRTYKQVADDLVSGHIGHCFLDESFGRAIEDSRQSTYRPTINPVTAGESFSDHLNHFAYYYRNYKNIEHGPQDLKVKSVPQGNCWLEGSGMILSSCLSVTCIGLVVLIPLALRVVLVWPRVIAIKLAVIDFLAGKFDNDLQRLLDSDPTAV